MDIDRSKNKGFEKFCTIDLDCKQSKNLSERSKCNTGNDGKNSDCLFSEDGKGENRSVGDIGQRNNSTTEVEQVTEKSSVVVQKVECKSTFAIKDTSLIGGQTNQNIAKDKFLRKTEILGKDQSLPQLKSTENISKPQKLILQIVNGTDINNYKAFLQQRIGKTVDFKIVDTVVNSTNVELVVEFPSRTASRKAILHMSYNKMKPEVWCYYHKIENTAKDDSVSKPNKSNGSLKQKLQTEAKLKDSEMKADKVLKELAKKDPKIKSLEENSAITLKSHDKETTSMIKSRDWKSAKQEETKSGLKSTPKEAKTDVASKTHEQKNDVKFELQEAKTSVRYRSRHQETKTDVSPKSKDTRTYVISKTQRPKTEVKSNSKERKPDVQSNPQETISDVISRRKSQELKRDVKLKLQETQTGNGIDKNNISNETGVKELFDIEGEITNRSKITEMTLCPDNRMSIDGMNELDGSSEEIDFDKKTETIVSENKGIGKFCTTDVECKQHKNILDLSKPITRRDDNTNSGGDIDQAKDSSAEVVQKCEKSSIVCEKVDCRQRSEIKDKSFIGGETCHDSCKSKSLRKDDFLPQSNSTENISKPQKLILEIVNGTDINNYKTFLQQRIGKSVGFEIEDTLVKSENVDLLVKFPSKTASRKATEILHLKNNKKKPEVWCYYYKGEKKATAHSVSKSNTSNINLKQKLQTETKPKGNETFDNEVSKERPKKDTKLKVLGENSEVIGKSQETENSIVFNCVKSMPKETRTDVAFETQEQKADVRSELPKTKTNIRSRQQEKTTDVVSKTQEPKIVVKSNSKETKRDGGSNSPETGSTAISTCKTQEPNTGVKSNLQETKTADKSKQQKTETEIRSNPTKTETDVKSKPQKTEGDVRSYSHEMKRDCKVQDEEINTRAKQRDKGNKQGKNDKKYEQEGKSASKIRSEQTRDRVNEGKFKSKRKATNSNEKQSEINPSLNKENLQAISRTPESKNDPVAESKGTSNSVISKAQETNINSESDGKEMKDALQDSKTKQDAMKVNTKGMDASSAIQAEPTKYIDTKLRKHDQTTDANTESLAKSDEIRTEGELNNGMYIMDTRKKERNITSNLVEDGITREVRVARKTDTGDTFIDTKPNGEVETIEKDACSVAKPVNKGTERTSINMKEQKKKTTSKKTEKDDIFQGQEQKTSTNSKCKPQFLEVEIVDLDKKETNLDSFLLRRLQKPITFKIKERETIQNVTFLSVEFPTTHSSKQAKNLLHKSNSVSKTKIWCSIDKERKLAMQKRSKNQKLSKFVSNLADVAKELITKHDVQLLEISEYLETFTDRKPKFQSVDVFQKQKKEKEALTSKQSEMEGQKSEFRSFLTSLYSKLETLKNTDFSENDLLELETAFKIECDRFSTALPIYARRTDIVKIIHENQTSIILGETGSGKSTQVVQYLYQTGRFAEGSIVCTQPRKVAAISLATRVAKEMISIVGHLVGYQVGLHTKRSKETQILYMTDHVLLNECLKDPLLSLYSCIIIDEAHERSIFTDLLLGMIKKCISLRPDLRVVVTSATIEPDVFVRFFGACPVLSVSGRTFPVDIHWFNENSDDNYEQRALQKAIDVHKTEDKGDILVFLTSPQEVEKCCQKFEDRLRGRNDFICLPLHGKLQANEQQRVFNPPSRGKRKIVFATNSAETSITIPGIKYVVDSGRIKEMQFDPKKNISSLVVTLVTKSSANQRSGRAGRTAPGKCFRLYSENEYTEMHACSIPEILRVNLGQALLKLMELGVDPLSFDFVESPPKDQMTKAMETLESIGAVSDGTMTHLGKWVAKLPFDPIFGVFVHDALECDVGIEALVITACCGSGGSLFYRSGSMQEKTNADKMKIRFSHQGGDVMTTLNAYREWHQQPEHSKGKWCAQNYVNGKTIKAARETVTEVLLIFRKELNIKLEFKFNDPDKVDLMLQKMIFKAFKDNICHFLGHDRAGYHVIHKEHNVCLFPSSALPSLGLQPEWIVIEQVLQINRDYGVNATPVPVEWIEEGLEEGWFKPFGMERAENQKVKQILLYGVGDQSFRDFVGPRYTRVKELESNVQQITEDSLVIVDTDSKTGEISIYSSNKMTDKLKHLVDNALLPIQKKYKDEKSEQYLSSTNQGTRLVISAGCNITDVLMPDEYKSVIVVSEPIITSWLTVEEVRNEFKKYGEIDHIEMFHFTKNRRNWGKVTFKTTQEAENAVNESSDEEIMARPTGNLRLQNEHRFRAKLEWCRRPSKGSGFVEFSHRDIVTNILYDYRHIAIGGTDAQLSESENSDSQMFIRKLNRFVNEEVLRHSFITQFGLADHHIIRASIIREKVQTSRRELEIISDRLHANLRQFIKEGRYSLYVKQPKVQDFTFLAFASFSKIEEGQNACMHLERNFRPNDEFVNTSVSLQASVLVIRTVFEKCSSNILETIKVLNEHNGVEIRHKLLGNGNCSIDMNCDHIDTLHRVRRKLDKIIQGKRMTKQEFPNIHELFTRSGKYEIRNVMTQTNTLIIDDYRILEISIFGDRTKQEKAFTVLHDYLYKLTQGVTKTLTLRGPDKPYGVIKEMFVRFGIDLGKLKRDISGLYCLQINLRDHTVSINGSLEAVDKGVVEINKVIDYLRENQGCEQVENDERQCSICFMEIEDGEIYRLEACGHPFCKTCIVPQLESAVGNNDFPISCCKEDCNELWSWRDLTKLSLQSGMSINNLVNRATSAYVAKNDKEYKYCISPDCPSIYRVTSISDVFCCCECEARICTACHTQYHDGLTCDMMKELKSDSLAYRSGCERIPIIANNARIVACL